MPKVILRLKSASGWDRELLRGIAKYSRLHGPWEFFSEPGDQEKMLPWLGKWGADGIIARISSAKEAKKIIATGASVIARVTIEPIPGLPNIISDQVAIGKMAAEHLLNRGFRHFAYCGYSDRSWSRTRCESLRKKVVKAGFNTNIYQRPRWRIHRSWPKEQAIIADWLKSLPKPVGLMVCDDDHARRIIESCKIAHLDVPEEIAVLGVDNDELVCELSEPPLSSIVMNAERGGYEAAELLDKLMAGKKTRKRKIIVQPKHVVTRQSTNILAIEDREVARAVNFIRQHAEKIIQVNDVVSMVPLSRRALERRFRKVLNRSILHEIRRVRIEQVSRKLVETNLPISQIASALGYSMFNNVTRYFRQEKGMSLREYRKRYGIR